MIDTNLVNEEKVRIELLISEKKRGVLIDRVMEREHMMMMVVAGCVLVLLLAAKIVF